jgi:hypothetical protein
VTVGELRKALEIVPDEMVVVAIDCNGLQGACKVTVAEIVHFDRHEGGPRGNRGAYPEQTHFLISNY